jgi:branched-chain amino acid transport system permease protein
MSIASNAPQDTPVSTAGVSPRARTAALLLGALAVAAVLPFMLSGQVVSQFTQVIIYAIALLGLNILTGFNGQISLGHGAFCAIGAYTAAILLDRTGIPYWATLPIAGAVCLLIGFLFGIPALRLDGPYLPLATFALAVAVPQMLRFHGLASWTGGLQGIVVAKPEPPPFLRLDADQWLYFFSLAVGLLMLVLARNLLRGRIGRAIKAIRDHPVAAASIGIDIARYKAITFGVSAMYTGVAGALGALAAQFVAPDRFSFFLSISLLVGMVVGGIGSIGGSIFGAIFIVYIPNLADQVTKAAPWAIYGLLLLGSIYVMPKGVAGLLQLIWAKMGRRGC